LARTYQIMDEPQPGGLSRVAVQPFWPLLAVMFGGAWLSWPWFVLNAIAIGSPTRRRETIIAICGFAGNFVLSIGIGTLLYNGTLPQGVGPYLGLGLIVWKLGISYWLFVLQSHTFGIYEYYGGTVQNGLIVVVAGSIGGRILLNPLFDAVPFLVLVLG